jgi:hypothetical protein
MSANSDRAIALGIGRTVARRYGADHKRRQAAFEPVVAVGGVICPRCLEPIEPGQLWDLDHSERVHE